MTFRCCAPAVIWVLVLAGCEKPEAAAPSASNPPSAAAEPEMAGWPATNAQPKLKTMKLFVGPEVVTAELALTPLQVATGMMFRKEMKENEGMLFVFARPHRTSFYMKNTLVPLTAAYIDSEGAILELVDLQPLDETPVLAASDNVQFVLEMKQGWFKRHNIPVGAVVTSETGRLKEAFRYGK
jgi:uncharacterized membrane protein (UPF0127 family)